MIQRHILLRDDQDEFLKRLPGILTEHIRRAIDEYIERLKKPSASASASGGEEGE